MRAVAAVAEIRPFVHRCPVMAGGVGVVARPGMAWSSGVARHGMARPRVARHGMARPRGARHGMARHGGSGVGVMVIGGGTARPALAAYCPTFTGCCGSRSPGCMWGKEEKACRKLTVCVKQASFVNSV